MAAVCGLLPLPRGAGEGVHRLENVSKCAVPSVLKGEDMVYRGFIMPLSATRVILSMFLTIS